MVVTCPELAVGEERQVWEETLGAEELPRRPSQRGHPEAAVTVDSRPGCAVGKRAVLGWLASRGSAGERAEKGRAWEGNCENAFSSKRKPSANRSQRQLLEGDETQGTALSQQLKEERAGKRASVATPGRIKT